MADEMQMRRDCIDAVQSFLERTEALPYVSVGMEGQYISDRNEFRDNSGKSVKTAQDRGTQLCFTFGDGDRDRTVYAFRLKDFTAKENRTAKSTRFAPDSGKPAVVVCESGPGGGIRTGVEDPARAMDMYRNTCMAANSLSYGAMFYGYLDHVHGGTKEYDASKAFLDEAKYKAPGRGWAVVRSHLGSPDGINAMSAWGVMSDALDPQVKPGSPKFGQLVSVASQAMGLEGLYGSLKKINDAMAADPNYKPDMNEVMNPNTDDGRVALRGLMCLAAYKQIKDRGGMDMVDTKGEPVVAIKDSNKILFEKLVYGRGDLEARNQQIVAADISRDDICKVHCVQKTFAGIKSAEGAKPDSLRAHQKYRLMRAALLGEDPDMPSGAPEIKLSPAPDEDPKKLNSRSIYVSSPDFPGDLPKVSLHDFLEAGLRDEKSGYGQVLSRLPAMKYLASKAGGTEALAGLAVKELDSGEAVDGLCLEMAVFQNTTHSKRLMAQKGPDGLTGDVMCDAFQQNAKDARDPAPNLIRSIYGAVGRPDFATGQMSLGTQYKADMAEYGIRLDDPDKQDTGKATRAATAARAFRAMDEERSAFVEATYQWSGTRPESMAEAETLFPKGLSADVYKSLLTSYRAEQQTDVVRGSMMLNDFIVMADCYGLSTPKELRELGHDIRAAYDDRLTYGYYRPVDSAEHEALRELYAKGGADPSKAFVQTSQQGTREGLEAVMRAANPDRETVDKLTDRLVKTAADHDTFDDHKNWDLAYQVAELNVSKFAKEAAQMAAQMDELFAGGQGKSGKDITD